MNITDYNKLQQHENQHHIALDFDGVIHKSSKGYYDGTVYDEPIDGVEYALKKLSKKYKIIIFTCKAKPDRPLINGKTGVELIWDWLETYNLKEYISDIVSEKPRASYYIDDKGIRFTNWNDTLKQIVSW